MHDGVEAVVFDQMITERCRSAAAKNAADGRKHKGQDVITNLREANRLSSGVLASNGIPCLNDPRFLKAYYEKRQKVIDKAKQSAAGKRVRLMKNIEGVTNLRVKYGDEKITGLPSLPRWNVEFTCSTKR